MSDNIRIKTTPGGGESLVNLQVNQKFDFIEILSLKISQDEAYRRFCSDYGVVVGRVIVNNGLGVPNAKVSIFIPVDEVDAEDPELLGMYPYKEVTGKDSDGIPYNLVPRNGRGKDECFTPIGTFPSKREIQDNPLLGEVYCKYYKFTTTTNSSGDFMIFGLPVGTHFMHVNADMSDIGILSQRPYDLIRDGASEKSFTSPTKFKGRKESPVLSQLKTTSPISVTVPPFWGDTEQCNIGIARSDVDLATNITPTAIFMGSIISDNDKHALNKRCRPRKKLGKMDEIVTGSGRIEMIRKTFDNGIERFDVEGGEVIDEDGAWAYQIPMNRDYMVTSEDGTLVPSGDPSKGIPTTARVRFRIGMMVNGDEGRLRTRAKYLVPHNPSSWSKTDFTFDTSTNDENFRDLSWNNIYTIKNHITRVQPNKNIENRNFIGLKNVDDSGSRNPFPFNKMDNDVNPLYSILCVLIKIIARLVATMNTVLISLLNTVIFLLNGILVVICNVIKGIGLLICFFPKWLVGSDCESKFCIGPNKDEISKIADCDCREILSYIPFIGLKCEDLKYIPGGKVSGKGYEETVEKAEEDGETLVWKKDTDGEGEALLNYQTCDSAQKLTAEGCDAGWSKCQTTKLADALDIFKFDFYNDWINGTLYAFLLKYKKKKNGKEKFCEVECDDFDSDSDNKCRSNYVIDSCTGALPQDEDNGGNDEGVNSKRFKNIKSGYIKNHEGELYYSPVTYDNNSKLFATDIVNLGSVFDCSWNGDQKFYQYLTDTTSNLPPLIDDKVGSDTITTGYDLFGEITCLAFKTNSDNCNNLKRICELGVGLDELRESPSILPLDPDKKITNADVDDPLVRSIFTKLNSNIISPAALPEIYIDSPNNTTVVNYQDQYYTEFRVDGGIRPANTSFWNNPVWVYDNSYYFYFGLNKGNTALGKMKRKYFTECTPEVDVDFFVVSDSIIADNPATAARDGAISINIFGGIGPYTFVWDQLTEGGVSYPTTTTTTSKTISGLIAGTYNVKAIDSVGNIANGTFTVPGPVPVGCNVQSTDTTQNATSDGKITVNLNGGVGDYTVTLYDTIDGVESGLTSLSSPPPPGATNPRTITTNSTEFVGLPARFDSNDYSDTSITPDTTKMLGYKVVVTDNTLPTPSSCESVVEINEPSAINVTLTKTDITCNGNGDGKIIANVTGGEAPYSFEWNSDPSLDTKNLSNLEVGSYELVVTDSIGATKTSLTETISEPLAISYNVTPKSGCNGTKGEIEIDSVIGGTPPYTVTINGGNPNITETITLSSGGSDTFDNLNEGKGPETYQITVEDSAGCFKYDSAEILVPATQLTANLTVDGNIGGNASDTVRTFTVSINGGIFNTNSALGDVYKYKVQVMRDTGGGFVNFGSLEDVSNTTYVFTDNYLSITPTGTYTYEYKVIVYDKNKEPFGCDATSNKESIFVTII